MRAKLVSACDTLHIGSEANVYELHAQSVLKQFLDSSFSPV